MAQLTNTRIYGNLNVDAITTINGDLNANSGINVNSKIVDDKQDSANNENKLSSIMLSSESNSYGKLKPSLSPVSSTLSQTNSLFSYTAEIKNNAGKLLSLDLHRVNSEEHKTFDAYGVKTYDINIDDTLYNISVNVSDFYKADNSEPDVSYDNVISTYRSEPTEKPADATTGVFRGSTNTTKSAVDVQLTVPYEGGEIITDETCDKNNIVRQFYVTISTTEQLTKLLNSNALLNCIYEGRHGVILYAVFSYASRYRVAYPVLFYINNGAVCMSCFSYSSGTFEVKNSLTSDDRLRLVVSTKELYDELTKDIA